MTLSKYFTSQQISLMEKNKLPKHIAIMPDGNRRWALKQLESTEKGHHSGANVIMEIVKAAKELGVKVITFYLFSTENWTRSKEEIAALMWLLKKFLRENQEDMIHNGIRARTIGDLSAFTQDVTDAIEENRLATASNSSIDMVMALNYGARDEMRRAFSKMLSDSYSHKWQPEHITESLISTYLDTASWNDPELLIRTSGEMRLSNFLLWQLSYTEIYFTNKLWPDFTPADLLAAILDFQKRERRLGGT